MKYIFIVVLLIACQDNKNRPSFKCSNRFKSLSFLSDSVSLKIPVDLSYTMVKFYSETSSYDTVLFNRDTSNYLSITVFDFRKFNTHVSTDVLPLLNGIASNFYSSDSTIIKTVKSKGNVEIGYLKRFYNKERKRGYFAAIVFYLKDSRRVEILFNMSSSNFKSEDIDTIMGSLKCR